MSTHTPAPGKGAIVIDMDLSALSKMDGMQIYALIDVFQTLDEVLSGLICQTRFANEVGGLNAAGTVLAEYSDSFTKVKELAADEAKSRTGVQATKDALWLGWAKVQYEMKFLDSLVGLSAIVAAAAAHVEDAANAG